MPQPVGCTSRRRRSASASRRSRSSSAASCSCARSPRGSPRRERRWCGWRDRSRCSSTTRSPSSATTTPKASRTTVPLAVNADSLATWFLEPLARLSERHPVVFELHRDDQDFTAGLLESGTVMGAVTSRATPVAGCRVSTLGAMRYEAVATPSFAARWLPDRSAPSTLAHAPLVDFDRRDDLQTRWLRACGIDEALPARHYVPASNDFAAAVRLGLGWALLPAIPVAGGAGCRRARAARRSADRRAPVLAAVEPALAAARRDRRRDRGRRADACSARCCRRSS